LLRTALAAAATTASGALLAACGGGASPTATSATTPTAVRPTTAPTTAPAASASASVAPTTGASAATAPAASAATGAGTTTAGAAASPASGTDGKLPSPAPGVPDAYTKFPTPFKTVNTIPGKGTKVTALIVAYNPPPPPRDQNKWWQEFEKRLGITFEPIIQPADGYPEKLASITASGSLPDLTFIYFEQVPDQYKVIQQGAYTDLTSELSGDALKQYPNLALFPAYLWKNSAISGKLYGAPRPLLPIGAQMIWNRTWAEKFGNPNPKNADEFYDLMVKFTKNDPDGNGKQDTWAIHTIQQFAFGLSFFRSMFRVPNEWRKNPDGTLTAFLETDEFKQAVTYMKKLYDAGIFHPDTATGNRTQRKDYITSLKVGMIEDLVTNFAGVNPNGYRDTARKLNNNPNINVTAIVPPGFDGGKSTIDLTSGFTGYAAIPAKVGKDSERTKELLRVINYLASPFGSEEWVFLNYGLEGVHHTVQPDGSRVTTDLGKAEIGDLPNLCNGLTTYWYPIPGDAQDAQNAVRDMIALGQENPVINLFSPTNAAKAGEFNQLRIDRVDAIVQGRDPLSAIDTYVKDWRSRGGDQIRKEYEAALKQ
jgi:putative aldouronate transport system substrate-binding protein